MKYRHHVINGQPRHLHGWRKQKQDHRDKAFAPGVLALLHQAPTSDLTTSIQFHIENQGVIGSCTGEGTSSAMESTLQKEGLNVQLSPLWLYDKGRTYEGTPLSEDSGCEIRDVVKVASLYGCPAESQWPFNDKMPSDTPPVSLDAEAAKHKVTYYYACNSDRATKASLLQGFPVVAGFNVPETMMSDEVAVSGLVESAKNGVGYVGGHCILIVGHDDNKKIGRDTGGWLCLNSWGTEWGLSGYFWMSYACRPDDRWTLRRISV